MRGRKYYLYLTEEERSCILQSLVDRKNKLLSEGRYTDAVDEIIYKISLHIRVVNIKGIIITSHCKRHFELRLFVNQFGVIDIFFHLIRPIGIELSAFKYSDISFCEPVLTGKYH